jgi:dipeptidyl aminopeptidase/acylaminoacyl peptidase
METEFEPAARVAAPQMTRAFARRDLRQSEAYHRADRYLRDLFAPDSDLVVDAADAAPRPNGNEIVFTGFLYGEARAAPRSVLCVTDTTNGATKRLVKDASKPTWSSDGVTLAYLDHDAQLVLRDWASGAITQAPAVDGVVEFLAWSPDGTSLLLGVAGYGADKPGVQGATTIATRGDDLPAWTPEIETGYEEHRWRRLWIWRRGNQSCTRLGDDATQIWEATWRGNHRVVAVASDSPVEGTWYNAPLIELGLNGSRRDLLQSELQLGCLAGAPDGRHVATVEAVCSDRWIVAGDLLLLDEDGGPPRRIDTHGIDVTSIIWRDAHTLTIAGRRKFETVIAEIDVNSGDCREIWSSTDLGCGSWYPAAAPMHDGSVVAITDGYAQPPALVRIFAGGGVHQLASFAHPGSAALLARIGRIEPYSWTAPDGLEIWGWLVRPRTPGPHPTILQIHGGPVHHHGNRWLYHAYDLPALVERGYALFYANPRGSNGNGIAYARHVQGDMGGADTYDFLTGLDALVRDGIADPQRLGVTGRSYGGFMSAWLVTQTDRFAAALPQAPVSNWYSQHRTSQIPHFDILFLDDDPSRPGGKYFERSPAMFGDRVKTPVLIVAGALDRSTPPTQALEFHRSIRFHGGDSTLITYPTSGHHISSYAARADYLARTIAWFETHLPI